MHSTGSLSSRTLRPHSRAVRKPGTGISRVSTGHRTESVPEHPTLVPETALRMLRGTGISPRGSGDCIAYA
eukprot:1307742-Rhodomonas_salina.3